MIIGGDGSLTGARIFAQEFDVPCIGLPGTIDNDLYGTDTTIGYDTALNTILDAVDKIRDTATSHERLFFVEVMGRDAGFLALNGAIASGAEAAIIPEFSTEVDQLEEFIKNGFRKSKNSSIVLVAESELTGGAMHYAERVKNEYPQYDVRVTILGHLQRGGSPTAHDRILASRLGAAAIDAIMEGQRNVMIGIDHDEVVYVPFTKAIKNDKPIKKDLVNVLRDCLSNDRLFRYPINREGDICAFSVFYNHFFTILSVLSHSSSICTCRVYFSERDLGRQLAFNVPVRLPASSSSNKPTALQLPYGEYG